MNYHGVGVGVSPPGVRYKGYIIFLMENVISGYHYQITKTDIYNPLMSSDKYPIKSKSVEDAKAVIDTL